MVMSNSTQSIIGTQQGVKSMRSITISTPEARPEEQVFVQSPQVTILNSYASIGDPEVGSELKFVPTHTINGVKCAKLDKEDVATEFEILQKAVICSV